MRGVRGGEGRSQGEGGGVNKFPMARPATEKADFRPALPLGFKPGVNGTHMQKLTYAEQLRHPNWQRKRLEALSAAGFSCAQCFGTDVTLHVHHKRYLKGRMAWEYELDELSVLCEDCHKDEHEEQEIRERLLAELNQRRRKIDVFFAAGAAFVDDDEQRGDRADAIGHFVDRSPLAYWGARLGWLLVERAMYDWVKAGHAPSSALALRFEDSFDRLWQDENELSSAMRALGLSPCGAQTK